MNIASYNVRGLGKGVKWAAIRRLINKENIQMLCLQETKKDSIDRTLCQAIWGSDEVKWEMQPATKHAIPVKHSDSLQHLPWQLFQSWNASNQYEFHH